MTNTKVRNGAEEQLGPFRIADEQHKEKDVDREVLTYVQICASQAKTTRTSS